MTFYLAINYIRNYCGFLSPKDNDTINDSVQLPNELIYQIFSHLNLTALNASCRVCRQWKQVAADNPLLWKTVIYRELAFNKVSYVRHFGETSMEGEDENEEFASLPLNIVDEYKKFQRAFPDLKKSAKDTLMLIRLPKTFNGKFKFIDFYDSVAEKIYPKYEIDGCNLARFVFKNEESVDKPHRVIVARDLILENKAARELLENKTLNVPYHQQVIDKLLKKTRINFEVPQWLEISICLMLQYLDMDSTKRKTIYCS